MQYIEHFFPQGFVALNFEHVGSHIMYTFLTFGNKMKGGASPKSTHEQCWKIPTTRIGHTGKTRTSFLTSSSIGTWTEGKIT